MDNENMRLIDYFAAKALPAIISMPDKRWRFDFCDAFGDETTHAEQIAMAAYAYAEAMLKARNHEFYCEYE